ncbi:MAG: Gfo/Idh/MocA family protein [Planctomycetota bacterium]
MVERTRIALIGAAGRIARDWRDAIAALPDVELVAAVDPAHPSESSDHVTTKGRGGKLVIVRSIDDIPRSCEFEAAIVATPPSTHVECVDAATARGAHVLCEKPLAIRSDEAVRMLSTARARGRCVVMASKFRFVADVALAAEQIARGDIGTPVLYENVFAGRVPMAERWNSNPAISGGGVLVDNGAHAADLARVLIGPLRRVLSVACRRIQPLVVEDSARIVFESEGGCIGVATLSWSVTTGDPAYARIHGSDGSIELCWSGARIHRKGHEGFTPFGSGYDKRAAFTSQLRQFVDSIRDGVPQRPSDQDALDSVRFIEAAQRSLVTLGFVDLHGSSDRDGD